MRVDLSGNVPRMATYFIWRVTKNPSLFSGKNCCDFRAVSLRDVVPYNPFSLVTSSVQGTERKKGTNIKEISHGTTGAE